MPVLKWLHELPPRAIIKCRARMIRLRQMGHDLRRPDADYVGDDIYELRILRAGQRYRMLYAFHEGRFVLLLAGFSKSQRRIPKREIELARRRLDRFLQDPKRHSHLVKSL